MIEYELLEKQRQEANKQFKLFLAIGIVVGLIVAGIGLYMQQEVVCIIGAVIAVVIIAFGSTKRNKVKKTFKQKVVTQIVETELPGSTYSPNTGLSLDVIMEPGFFKRPDRHSTEDYISATYNDIPFVMSDFDLKERHEHHTKNGTTVTYDTYAQGRFFVFDFKREFNLVVKVMEEKFVLFKGGLQKIQTESIEFNKKFTTLASNEITAFYILTPQVQLKLLEFEKAFSGRIYFAFMNGKLYLAIDDRKDGLEIDFGKPITEDGLQYLTNQLQVPKDIIDGLHLNEGKFAQGNDADLR